MSTPKGNYQRYGSFPLLPCATCGHGPGAHPHGPRDEGGCAGAKGRRFDPKYSHLVGRVMQNRHEEALCGCPRWVA